MPPLHPHDAAIFFDLSEIEGTPFADFYLGVTPEDDEPYGEPLPRGISVSANRRGHGADIHLTWEQARQVRDVLTQLLRDAGQE